MSQKKPILILCNDYQLGKKYFTKHLGHVNDNKQVVDDNWVDMYIETDIVATKLALKNHQKIDVEGYILPEFWENPEQTEILLEIGNHKSNIDRQLAVQFLQAIAPSTKT